MSGLATGPGLLERGPLFWGGLMLASYLVVAALGFTGAVEGPALYLLVIMPFSLVVPMIAAANRRSEANAAGCLTKGEAQRRYMKRMALFAFLYMVVVGMMSFGLKQSDIHPALRTFLALLPGLAIIGVFWSIGRLIVEERDEFLRMLVVRQSLIASGFAMCAASVWGFLETAAVVPHVDAYWWVVVWSFGLGLGAISNRLHYGTWGAL